MLGASDNGNSNTQNFNDHVGSISMTMILGLFGSAQSIILSFPFERPMFLREYSTGTCKRDDINLLNGFYLALLFFRWSIGLFYK